MLPSHRRSLALAAPLVVAAATLSSCSSAPTDAEVGAFCDRYVAVLDVTDGEGLRTWAENFNEVGTPSKIGPDAREGFELLVEAASEVDADADLADIEPENFSDAETTKVEAFSTFVGETCATQLQDALAASFEDFDGTVEESGEPEKQTEDPLYEGPESSPAP